MELNGNLSDSHENSRLMQIQEELWLKLFAVKYIEIMNYDQDLILHDDLVLLIKMLSHLINTPNCNLPPDTTPESSLKEEINRIHKSRKIKPS